MGLLQNNYEALNKAYEQLLRNHNRLQPHSASGMGLSVFFVSFFDFIAGQKDFYLMIFFKRNNYKLSFL